MKRGFTLVEAMVALTIAAIVTAGLSLAFRTGLDASDRLRRRADAHSEARSILAVLVRDLSAAFLSAANPSTTQFTATPPEETPPGEAFLTFTALAYRRSPGPGRPADEPRSDAVLVEYFLETAPGTDTGAKILVRRERLLTALGPGEPEVISERIAELRLRYSGEETWSADPERDPPVSAVEGEDTGPTPTGRELPRQVEVTLLLAPARADLQPDAPRPPLTRLYRTVISIRADGVAPFETEVTPPPANQPASGNGGRDGAP